MKASDIRNALPETPDSVTAGVQAAIGRALRTDGNKKTRVRPGRLLTLVAAAAVVLVAAGFTVAAATGAFRDVKEEAEAQAAAFDYEQKKADWRQVNWTPWALVNATDEVNGAVFTLAESMLYLQNAPDYYLSAQVFYDASVTGLQPDRDAFTLTVDGQELQYDAFCTEQWNAAGIWEDGQRYFDLAFPYENRFPIGSEITLSGTLHTYDDDGNQTGVFGDLSITYTLTQAMVEAMTEKNAAEMAAYEQAAVDANAAAVQQLPDTVTVVNETQNGVTLHEISLENGRLFYSVTVPEEQTGNTTALYIGGIAAQASVLYMDGQTQYCCAVLPYAVESLPDSWLIAMLYDQTAGTCGLLFRFDPKTQQVQMPTAEELPLWLVEWQSMSNPLPTLFTIGDTKTVGDITVTVESLQYEYGYWTLYAYLSGNADYHTPQEFAPTVTVNGVTATVTNEYPRYEYLEPSLEGEPPTPVFFTLDLPFLPTADGKAHIVIDWPVYDRGQDGAAFIAGTYTLDKTF